MPYGKGTYGSKVGRPKKKKSKNGSPKRRKTKRSKRNQKMIKYMYVDSDYWVSTYNYWDEE